MPKQRLDTLLAERGLFPSRTRAAASVMAGEVQRRRRAAARRQARRARRRRRAAQRAGARPAFVSRGGIKLANALARAAWLSVRGRRAIDVGASTGGFTDCLLQRGAARGDRRRRRLRDARLPPAHRPAGVGAGAHERARAHARDAARAARRGRRAAGPGDGRRVVHLAREGARRRCSAASSAAYDVLALVKPQFELGRGARRQGRRRARGRRAPRARSSTSGAAALALGAAVRGYHSSGLPGPKGNRETFIWLVDPDARRHAPQDARRARGSSPARSSREGDHRLHPPAPRGHPRGAASCSPSAPSEAGVTLRLDRRGDAQARPRRRGPGLALDAELKRRRRAVRGARRRRHDPARAAALREHRRAGVRDQLRRDRLPGDGRARRDRGRHPPRARGRLRAAAPAGDRGRARRRAAARRSTTSPSTARSASASPSSPTRSTARRPAACAATGSWSPPRPAPPATTSPTAVP